MRLGILGHALCSSPRGSAHAQADDRDWPMYNHDVLGTRHNAGETTLDKVDGSRTRREMAVPRQRLDGRDRGDPCHAHGRQRLCLFRYSHRPDILQAEARRQGPLDLPSRRASAAAPTGKGRFQASDNGIMTSALVTDDTVYFADLGGWIYALDRVTGSRALEAQVARATSSRAHIRSTSSLLARSSPAAS